MHDCACGVSLPPPTAAPARQHPPPSVLFCSFSHLSQQTPLLFITASALREPPVNPWHHTSPISKGMKIQTALCHQFALPSLVPPPPSRTTRPNPSPPALPQPLHLPQQAMQSTAAAPTVDQSELPQWERVLVILGLMSDWVGGWGAEIKQPEPARGETGEAGGVGACRRSAEDALQSRFAAPVF